MCAHVEPRDAPTKDLNAKLALFEVFHIEVGDFQFASCGRFKRRSELDNLRVVEIESGDGIRGFWPSRFFFDAERPPLAIEFHDAVTLRIIHAVGKYRCPISSDRRALQQLGKTLSIENVVAKGQSRAFAIDKAPPDKESLC